MEKQSVVVRCSRRSRRSLVVVVAVVSIQVYTISV